MLKWLENLLKGKNSNATVGKYPVPPGTKCSVCDKPANGSIGGKEGVRFYLCLEHLQYYDEYAKSIGKDK